MKVKRSIHDTRFTIHDKGFTLIELLVVIAIMGTLITILLPNFIGARQRSNDARRKSDIEQISSALEQYRSVAGAYPTTFPTPCAQVTPISLIYTDTSVTPNLTTTFMSSIPMDPGCATYGYRVPTITTTDYTVCTYLSATSSTTSISGVSCGANNCNYCKGPYGAK